MNFPTDADLIRVFRDLLAGSLTRSEAAAWAERWLIGDVRVSDPLLWDALQLLGAADLISTDRPYLYETDDFADLLNKLEARFEQPDEV